MRRFVKAPFFPFIITVAAYALMLLQGLSGITGDEMGYSVLCFYISAPVISLLCGFFAGRKRGWVKWLFPLTGLLNWLVAAAVFGGRFIFAEFILLTVMATVPAISGLLAAVLSTKRLPSKEIDKMSAQDLS